MKIISRLKKNNILVKTSRLKRKIFAEWQQIQLSDPDLIQYLTDAMTYGYSVQIDYNGGGWRTIQPYGWNSSKDQNILLMAYKDTGEVRSYRLDRIDDLYIDMTANSNSINDNPEMVNDQNIQMFNDTNSDQSLVEDQAVEQLQQNDMPLLPEEEINTVEQGIYDNELDLLDNTILEEPEILEDPETPEEPIKNDKEESEE